MKIYTRTGDSGQTGLYGGERVSKSALRVTAYGSVDEASSFIGLARAGLMDRELDQKLAQVQSLLFELGADLATPHTARQRDRLQPITAEDVTWVEQLIDSLDQELEPLTAFILPGGDPAAAALHVARSVVRRAEREAVALMEQETVNPETVRFLNRVSDLLFNAARLVNTRTGVSEHRWQARQHGS